MRRLLWLIPAIVAIITFVSLNRPDPQLASLQQETKTPIWASGDHQEFCRSILDIEGDYLSPFHRKSVRYKAGVDSLDSMKHLFYQFHGFRTYFVYKGSFLVGAQTYTIDDPHSRRLLAEARYHHLKYNGQERREVEEFHYDRAGRLTFYCRSEIDPRTGVKIAEREQVGKKHKEYYPFWPH